MKKILAVCTILCLPLSAMASEGYTVLFKTQGTFQDVRDALQFALEGKGLKINHTNMIAEMLARTGPEGGATKQGDVEGDQFEIGSSTISRQMMEAVPHALVMCPY